MCSTSRMLHVYLLGMLDRALAMLSGKVAPRAALPNDCRKERLSTAIDWLKPRGPLEATSHTTALFVYRPSRYRHLGCCKSRSEGRTEEQGRRAGRSLAFKANYGQARSSSTTSERSCTRSRTTSRPSGEISKSPMSKSGERLVNCRWAPVSRSMSQRFLC